MKTVERYITLAASLCSMFAFVILLFEKTDSINLSIEKVIFTILFCLYTLFFTTLALYGFQQIYILLKEFKNQLFKICLASFFTFFIVAFYIVAIAFAWKIFTDSF